MGKIFKNYKKLYKTELSNRKLYEERYKELYDENILLQMEVKDAKKVREECAKTKIKLDDTKGFLAQEKEAKEELLRQREELIKERTELRKKITKLGGSWKDGNK